MSVVPAFLISYGILRVATSGGKTSQVSDQVYVPIHRSPQPAPKSSEIVIVQVF